MGREWRKWEKNGEENGKKKNDTKKESQRNEQDIKGCTSATICSLLFFTL